jgi:predicted RNA-binding Zn-ribbon protein involved in translation (DUF1610 family)
MKKFKWISLVISLPLSYLAGCLGFAIALLIEGRISLFSVSGKQSLEVVVRLSTDWITWLIHSMDKSYYVKLHFEAFTALAFAVITLVICINKIYSSKDPFNKSYLDIFINLFMIKELRTRILYTIALLILVRIGSHILLPSIDASILAEANKSSNTSGFFSLYNLFVGGALSRTAILSLGIMPFISSYIIFVLLWTVFPYFQKLRKDGVEGRNKLNQLIRFGAIPIAIVQAWGISVEIASRRAGDINIISPDISMFIFTISTIVFLTTGTILLMWFSEHITERGIGYGIYLIIFIGIIDRFPHSIFNTYQFNSLSLRNILIEAIYTTIIVFIIASVKGIIWQKKEIVKSDERIVSRNSNETISQLEKLGKLKEQNLLTEEEFLKQKSTVLNTEKIQSDIICVHCGKEISIDKESFDSGEFVCPKCNKLNDYKTSMEIEEFIDVVCKNCNKTVEVDPKEFKNKIFLCPDCGKERSIN